MLNDPSNLTSRNVLNNGNGDGTSVLQGMRNTLKGMKLVNYKFCIYWTGYVLVQCLFELYCRQLLAVTQNKDKIGVQRVFFPDMMVNI